MQVLIVKTLKIGERDIVSESSTHQTKSKNVKESWSVRWNQICWTGLNEVKILDKDRSIRQIQTKLECWIRSGMSDEVEMSDRVGDVDN
jgi:hypothetical protein